MPWSCRRAAYRDRLTAAGIDDLPVFIFTLDRAGSAQGTRRSTAGCSRRDSASARIPATGGASGPLGCYLSAHDAAARKIA